MLVTSRAPQEMPPTWNVVLLMTPLSWLCTLATMMAVVVFLDITSLMVKRGMGLSVTTREIVLYPFRCYSITTGRLIHSLRWFSLFRVKFPYQKVESVKGKRQGKVFAMTTLNYYNLLFLIWAVFGGFIMHMLSR